MSVNQKLALASMSNEYTKSRAYWPRPCFCCVLCNFKQQPLKGEMTGVCASMKRL